jgi:hypothetical protein
LWDRRRQVLHRTHTSAGETYVSIRQQRRHTSAYVRTDDDKSSTVHIRHHTSAQYTYVTIRQQRRHTSAYFRTEDDKSCRVDDTTSNPSAASKAKPKTAAAAAVKQVKQPKPSSKAS